RSAMRPTGPRLVLLVLDGLGIGAQPDAPTDEANADTLRSIRRSVSDRALPNLADLGLFAVADMETRNDITAGRSSLGYPGADTYLGHLVMLGVPPSHVGSSLLAETADALAIALRDEGFEVESAADGGVLVVDGGAVIHDNVEAAPGLGINVTASLDEMGWERVVAAATVVRRVVRNPRVIAVGGHGHRLSDALDHLVERSPGQIGIDTPGLGVYRRMWQVRHLPLEVAAESMVTARAYTAGFVVTLLGKAADVVPGPATLRDASIPTEDVIDRLVASLAEPGAGVIMANVQETDLAGHLRDADRFAAVLREVDGAIPRIIDALSGDDVLIVTADHGNDPCRPGSNHSREYVPLLAAGDGIGPAALGTRDSLADIGATVADLLRLEPLADGEPGRSFAETLRRQHAE
ncbi:MAG TPA: phosphopentomutase, partial [Candidatus Limnocylindrales bacterium]|nr:phosphopentomutase [Candidatus Limnocylindrales bacterium]